MSAYMVSRETIDVLITAGLYGFATGDRHEQHGMSWYSVDPITLRGFAINGLGEIHRRLDSSTADQVGAMLWHENQLSVNFRYREDDIEPVYTFCHHPGFRPTPVEALAALSCYDYQSCEHDGWPASEAFQFCEALKDKAIHSLPGRNDAPRDWTSSDILARRSGSISIMEIRARQNGSNNF